ncbi:MAG: hypothetical protein AAGB05_13400 [Pseudomonadota bacterium]
MQTLSPFVDQLIAAHRTGGRFRPEHEVPTTVDAAYLVHEALMEALGPIGGFKVSQKPNQAAVVAPIPESRCRPSGAHFAASAGAEVELEIGFVVVDTVPEPSDPEFRRRLLSAVRPAPMIEVVASRIDGPLGADPFVKLADLQACDALIFGDAHLAWQGTDMAHADALFTAGERTVFEGRGAVPAGTAVDALVTAVHVLRDRFGGLQPGQKLLTGALFAPSVAMRGRRHSGSIEGLGKVTVDL